MAAIEVYFNSNEMMSVSLQERPADVPQASVFTVFSVVDFPLRSRKHHDTLVAIRTDCRNTEQVIVDHHVLEGVRRRVADPDPVGPLRCGGEAPADLVARDVRSW